MPVEIEKKFLVDNDVLEYLTEHFDHEILGIAQWYIDNARQDYESKRIRMIVTPDAEEKWIEGTKKAINNSLVIREEHEKEVQINKTDVDLVSMPFVMKIRYVFKNFPKVELVVDEFPENPFIHYDVQYLMEIEIDESFEDYDETFKTVTRFFNLHDLQDVSEDLNYTNHAIARRCLGKRLKDYQLEEIKVLLYKKIKVVK